MKAEGKRRALTVVSVFALTVVVVSPAAASWHGLVGAGREVFGLSGGWEYVVPLTLDGAALYAGALSIRAILAGDSAVGARALTAAYALASAAFNGWHAATVPSGNIPSALFFAGASLSAVVLWDVTLRAMRRDQLRDAGCIEAPLPRFRLLRWLVDLPMTARAWRLAVIEQISDPTEALRRAREQHTNSPHSALAERVSEPTSALTEGAATHQEDSNEQGKCDASTSGWRPAEGSDHSGVSAGGSDIRNQRPDRGRIDGLGRLGLVHERSPRVEDVPEDDFRGLSGSKADCVRTAFAAVGGRDVPAALAWLAERGVTVDRSYAYTVHWPASPSLRAVASECAAIGGAK